MAKKQKPVVHFEIGCDNLPETIEFYKKVFHWNITPNGNAAAIDAVEEHGIPGHITKLGHEPRNYINMYIATDSITEDLETIEAAGGKTVVGPIELPDGKSFAWFKDVAGNTVGLISS